MPSQTAEMATHGQSSVAWFYPSEIAHDLDGVQLPQALKDEALASAWEYARCVIPHYTNSKRYLAFLRLLVISVVAVSLKKLIDTTVNTTTIGHDLDSLLTDLFDGMACREAMAREFRTFLFFATEKSSDRVNTEYFQRYLDAMASSPEIWVRFRDCDALVRWTLAAALACNDRLDTWFFEPQLQVLCEIAEVMYDGVAFYKHRAEGETHNTFAYAPEAMRVDSFRRAREILWALDVGLKDHPAFPVVTNLLRFFGGPPHMMMRRYRFVEEDLTIGQPENELVVDATRKGAKLWHRLQDDSQQYERADEKDFRLFVARHGDFMFSGLVDALRNADEGKCSECKWVFSQEPTAHSVFGGPQLCGGCKEHWRQYLELLPERALHAFPELGSLNRPLPDLSLEYES